MRNRIDYGIDLGTTNSAIARIENGEAVIKKSEFQKDTTASAIAFGRKGKKQLGDSASNQLKSDRLAALKHFEVIRNVFVEFKRTMGTDETYVPDIAPETCMNSEQLSAEVLKKLKSYVSDETVHAAVITIPAHFEVQQQQATQRAGELAGFKKCQLLQEPVAAAMAFVADGQVQDGKFIVFDFGGGTFDCALVVCEGGNMTVTDTEGDNFLGGKDLDYAIVDGIILPHLQREFAIDTYLNDSEKKSVLRDAMKSYAEEIKIQLSFKPNHEIVSNLGEIPLEDENGEELELDFSVGQEELREVVVPIFQRAIDKASALLDRNGLKGGDLQDLVLVGGPTMSPIVREMLAAQIRKPNTSADPMTAIARGAAIFASTIEVGTSVEAEQKEEATKAGLELLQLEAKYEATSLQDEEYVVFKCGGGVDVSGMQVELKRTGWMSGKMDLKSSGTMFEAKLEEGKANVFQVVVTDAQGNSVDAQPSSITILQGTKVGGSPLPSNLGIEVWNGALKKRLFGPLKGAEKGRPLPVTGIANRLRTTQELKPGNMDSSLHIRVFEGNADAIGKSTVFCTHITDYVLSGGEIARAIPEGSEFDLTLKTEPTSSIPVLVRLSFLSLDMEFDLTIPSQGQTENSDWFDRELSNGKVILGDARNGGHSDVSSLSEIEKELDEAQKMMTNATDRGARDQATARLKEALRKLEGIVGQEDWPKALGEMENALSDLIRKNAESATDATTMLVKDFERKVEHVKKTKDVSAALMLAEEMESAYRSLIPREHLLHDFILYCYKEFDSIPWTDQVQARSAVDAAARVLIQENPSVDEMQQHVSRLSALFDDSRDEGNVPPIPQ